MVGPRNRVFVASLVFALGSACGRAHVSFAADTPQSATLKGQGAFLRGAGSYNLNTAKAESIHVDTVMRWKQDLRKIEQERRSLREQQEARKNEKAEEVKLRIAKEEYDLRANPSAADVQSGRALNALLFDLMDPDLSAGDWYAKPVSLPKGVSVPDLIFRFTPARGSPNATRVLSKGVIALSRLDVQGQTWPIVMKDSKLNIVRANYETSYAKLRDELINDRFDVKTLLALDQSLKELRSKSQTAIDKERGFRDQAVRFVDDLTEATHMFDAATVEYAREILLDTKNHEAKTVAELVSFMLKYRLQFASAERNASAAVLYNQIYEAMRQQADAFGIKPVAPAGEHPGDEAASAFQPKSVWAGKDARTLLTVLERNGDTFQAQWKTGKKLEKTITGTVKGNTVSWLGKDSRGPNGKPGGRDFVGIVKRDADGERIEFVWKDIHGKPGTIVLYRLPNPDNPTSRRESGKARD